MKCLDLNLKKFSAIELTLFGSVEFRDLHQQAKVRSVAPADRTHQTRNLFNWLSLTLQNMAFLKRYTGESSALKFKTFIRVDYDENRYVLSSLNQEVCCSSKV